MAGESTVLGPCDFQRRNSGRPAQSRGSGQLVEAEECNREPQLSKIGWLLQALCSELFFDSRPAYMINEKRCQFLVVRGVRE